MVFSVRIITAHLVLELASPIKYHTSSRLLKVVAIGLIVSLSPEPLAVVYCITCYVRRCTVVITVITVGQVIKK